MAKFRLNPNSVFTIATNAVPCPTSITINDVADEYASMCAGLTNRAHILGSRTITGSFSGEVESDADAELAYVAKGVSGALLLQPNGTTATHIKWTATTMLITGRDVSLSSTGLTTYTCTFALNDLTLGSN